MSRSRAERSAFDVAVTAARTDRIQREINRELERACENHSAKAVNKVCVDCGVTLCDSCAGQRSHRGHAVDSIQKRHKDVEAVAVKARNGLAVAYNAWLADGVALRSQFGQLEDSTAWCSTNAAAEFIAVDDLVQKTALGVASSLQRAAKAAVKELSLSQDTCLSMIAQLDAVEALVSSTHSKDDSAFMSLVALEALAAAESQASLDLADTIVCGSVCTPSTINRVIGCTQYALDTHAVELCGPGSVEFHAQGLLTGANRCTLVVEAHTHIPHDEVAASSDSDDSDTGSTDSGGGLEGKDDRDSESGDGDSDADSDIVEDQYDSLRDLTMSSIAQRLVVTICDESGDEDVATDVKVLGVSRTPIRCVPDLLCDVVAVDVDYSVPSLHPGRVIRFKASLFGQTVLDVLISCPFEGLLEPDDPAAAMFETGAPDSMFRVAMSKDGTQAALCRSGRYVEVASLPQFTPLYTLSSVEGPHSARSDRAQPLARERWGELYSYQHIGPTLAPAGMCIAKDGSLLGGDHRRIFSAQLGAASGATAAQRWSVRALHVLDSVVDATEITTEGPVFVGSDPSCVLPAHRGFQQWQLLDCADGGGLQVTRCPSCGDEAVALSCIYTPEVYHDGWWRPVPHEHEVLAADGRTVDGVILHLPQQDQRYPPRCKAHFHWRSSRSNCGRFFLRSNFSMCVAVSEGGLLQGAVLECITVSNGVTAGAVEHELPDHVIDCVMSVTGLVALVECHARQGEAAPADAAAAAAVAARHQRQYKLLMFTNEALQAPGALVATRTVELDVPLTGGARGGGACMTVHRGRLYVFVNGSAFVFA